MSVLVAVRRLVFVDRLTQTPDTLETNSVALGDSVRTFAITMRWLPRAETWYLNLRTTSGVTIVSGAWVRDRTDCLLGVSTPGRPAGAIMSFDPKGRGDPTRTSYAEDGVGLFFVPGGLDPHDYSLYTTLVV